MSSTTAPAFGNYLLQDFAEIVMPAPIPWLPQAPGWWLLFALLMIAVVVAVWRAFARWRRNAYRRAALRRLDELEAGTDWQAGIAELPVVLKTVALAAYPRVTVASLSGAAWLNFLDAHCPHSRFRDASGNWLVAVGYQPRTDWLFTEAEARVLLSDARLWIRHHRVCGNA